MVIDIIACNNSDLLWTFGTSIEQMDRLDGYTQIQSGRDDEYI